MRHHGGADDANGDIEHVRIGDHGLRRDEAGHDLVPLRLYQAEIDREADEYDREQRHYQRFQITKAALLQPQDQQDVDCGQQNAVHHRDVKQQVQRNRRTNDFRQVGCANRDFTQYPLYTAGRR